MKIKIVRVVSFIVVFLPLFFYLLINLVVTAPEGNYENKDIILFLEDDFVPCRFDKIDFQKINNDEVIVDFYRSDLSVIPEYEQIVCLGKVNNYKINGDFINLEFGTNPIFNILLIFSSLTYLLFTQIKFKIFRNNIYLLQNLTFSILFEFFFQPLLNISSIISRIMIFLIFYFFYVNYFSPNFSKNIHTGNSLINYSFISLLGFIFAFSGKTILKDNFIGNDQFLNLIAAKKINFLGYSNFESTWNQHSALIPELYKYVFYNFPTNDYQANFFILFVFVITLISINFQSILNKFGIPSQKSLIYTLSFFIVLVSLNLGNRLIGILVMSLIIIFLLNFLDNKKATTLFLLIFFSIFQIYNMESYGLAILGVFFFIIKISKNKLSLILQSFIFSIISIFLVFSREILNSEIPTLIKTNYLFHIFNTKSQFSGGFFERIIAIYESLTYPFSRGSNFTLILYLIAVTFAVYIIVNSKSFENKYKVIAYIFIFELTHLILTGPRFSHYSEIILLPGMILFFLMLDNIIESTNISGKNFYLVSLIILLMSISSTSTKRVKEIIFSKDFTQTSINFNNQKASEDLEVKQIIQLLRDNNLSETTIFWTNQADWYWIIDNGNTLPSTRMWWWIKMRYVDEEKYDWSRNWNENEFKSIYLEDYKNENPKFVLIDKTYKSVPDIVNKIIESEYFLIFESEKYSLFQSISQQ